MQMMKFTASTGECFESTEGKLTITMTVEVDNTITVQSNLSQKHQLLPFLKYLVSRFESHRIG